MTLTLSIRNVDYLDNGSPTAFVLHRRGATIGRDPTCDWSLPDPHRYISSRHCEIDFENETYVLNDVSTNGTFLNGSQARLSAPHPIGSGDLFQIGQYEVIAELSGSALAASAPAGAEPVSERDWAGWDSHVPGGAPASAPAQESGQWSQVSLPPGGQSDSGWDSVAPSQPAGRWGAPPAPPPEPAPAASGWHPSHRAEMPSASSAWDTPSEDDQPASHWSSAAPDQPPAPSPDDVWGRIVEGNVVDWARGGFGQPQTPAADPLGLNRDNSAHIPQGATNPPQHRPAAPPPAPPSPAPVVAPARAQAPPAGASEAEALRAFFAASGLAPGEVSATAPQLLAKAGALLRSLTAGLFVLVEARARAKSQMGAESTRLELNGNNPIKFARTPEQALLQLLNPEERGFMDAERAVEDSYRDLQSHQMATLKAMQGALKATLDRFSPEAIRRRTEQKGVLARLLPGAKEAALWQSYEREFSGVAQGSDEAFMDVFAKEFRKAYEEQSRSR